MKDIFFYDADGNNILHSIVYIWNTFWEFCFSDDCTYSLSTRRYYTRKKWMSQLSHDTMIFRTYSSSFMDTTVMKMCTLLCQYISNISYPWNNDRYTLYLCGIFSHWSSYAMILRSSWVVTADIFFEFDVVYCDICILWYFVFRNSRNYCTHCKYSYIFYPYRTRIRIYYISLPSYGNNRSMRYHPLWKYHHRTLCDYVVLIERLYRCSYYLMFMRSMRVFSSIIRYCSEYGSTCSFYYFFKFFYPGFDITRSLDGSWGFANRDTYVTYCWDRVCISCMDVMLYCWKYCRNRSIIVSQTTRKKYETICTPIWSIYSVWILVGVIFLSIYISATRKLWIYRIIFQKHYMW